MLTFKEEFSSLCQENGYKLGRKLGDGTYGKVYKATLIKTDQKVAIKYINFKDDNKQHLRSLCREVYVMNKLSLMKNNVFTTRLLDIFCIKDALHDYKKLKGIYLVMDYMPYSLDDFLDKELTEDQCITLI